MQRKLAISVEHRCIRFAHCRLLFQDLLPIQRIWPETPSSDPETTTLGQGRIQRLHRGYAAQQKDKKRTESFW